MVDVKIACKTCGKRGLMDNMKYDPENRKLLVCPECYGSKAARLEKGSRVKKSLENMQEKKEIHIGKLQTVRERLASRDMGIRNIISDKAEYQCTNCKYEFSRAKSFPLGGMCPNCGKQSLHRKAILHHDWVADMEP